MRLTKQLVEDEPYGPGRHQVWHLLDDTGAVVGALERDHRFTGSRIVKRPHYTVAYNPGGRPGLALWVSRDHPTARAALDALAAHLDEEGVRAPND